MEKRLCAVYVMNLLDLMWSAYWVKLYGPGIVVSPIVRWLCEANLIYWVKIAGVGIALVWMYHLLKHDRKWQSLSWVLLLWYSGVTVYHLAWSINTIFV